MNQEWVLRFFRAGIALSGIVFFMTVPRAQDVLSTWGRSKPITINTSATGANVTGNVRNFPLLVRLDSTQAEVFTQSKPNGADLRFHRPSVPSGGNLPYKIDSWDSAGRKAVLWVLVDSIYGNRATQTINMYWQKSTATAVSNGAAVFDSGKGFVGAWHMGGANGPRANDVAGGPAAVSSTTVVDSVFAGRSRPGIIGTADSLRGGTGAGGGGEYFDVSPMPAFQGGFTFSFWAYVTSTTNRNWMRFFDFASGEEANANIFAGREGTTTTVRFDVLPTQLPTLNGLAANQWKFYSFTVAAPDPVSGTSTMVAFIDGDSTGTNEATIPDADRTRSFLGRSNYAADAYFTGLMDEVHVSKTARSSSWVKLSYATQRTGASVLTFGTSGPAVAVAPGHSAQASRLGSQPLRIVRQGAGFTFELPVAESGLHVTVTDVWGRAVWSTRTGKHDRAVAWNGRAAGGAPLARGMYLARVAPVAGAGGGGGVWEGKIAFTK